MREMKEEIGQEVAVGDFLCTIENFFTENGKRFHEVGIYYSMSVPDEWIGSKYMLDGGARFEYRWVSFEELNRIVLYPEIMKKIIFDTLHIRHYIIGKEESAHLHPWRK